MSRSEFFARAADRYLEELDSESVTRQMDDALAALEEDDDSAAAAVAASRRALLEDPDDW